MRLQKTKAITSEHDKITRRPPTLNTPICISYGRYTLLFQHQTGTIPSRTVSRIRRHLSASLSPITPLPPRCFTSNLAGRCVEVKDVETRPTEEKRRGWAEETVGKRAVKPFGLNHFRVWDGMSAKSTNDSNRGIMRELQLSLPLAMEQTNHSALRVSGGSLRTCDSSPLPRIFG